MSDALAAQVGGLGMATGLATALVLTRIGLLDAATAQRPYLDMV